MKRKNKFILFMFILLVLIFILKNIIYQKKIKYEIKYNDNYFNVIQEKKNNSYYIEIVGKNIKYPLKVNNKNEKTNKIVNNIYYYNDENYECILPIINYNVLYDMVCLNDGILYSYINLYGGNSNLDEYVKNIKEYNVDQFKNDISKETNVQGIIWYDNNKINKIVAITSYNGVITQKGEVKLFNKDLYDNQISAFVDKFYLIADYDEEYDFKKFYVVDLDNNEVFTIKSKNEISFDSYIQGVVDDIVYLYDIDNEIQYSIDVKSKKIKVVSSNEKVKYYENEKWTTISKAKANKKLLFNYDSLDNNFSSYDRAVKSGYNYYLFKYEKDFYRLFRVNENMLDVVKYIADVPSQNVTIDDDSLYFVSGNTLYYYSDSTALKSILKYDEFTFNSTIKYYIH